MPRRHASRRVSGVNSLSPASAVIFSSSRARRPLVASTTVSYASSNAAGSGSSRNAAGAATGRAVRSTPCHRSRRSRAAAAVSTADAGLASNPAGLTSRARTRSRAASSAGVGIRTDTISSSRSNRARCRASRASVFTRSPAGRCSFDDAATSHRHPAAVSARAQPEPGRPGLVDHRARTRQPADPLQHIGVRRRQPRLEHLPGRPSIAAATTDRACTSSPTLVRSANTGASQTVGKAEHGTRSVTHEFP